MSCIFSCFQLFCCRDTTQPSLDHIDPIADLQAIDPKKIPIFSFKGRQFIARIVDVYDGDTCTILFRFNEATFCSSDERAKKVEATFCSSDGRSKKVEATFCSSDGRSKKVGEVLKYKVRAYGYDCAEMKPKKDDPNREKEKALAVAARNRFIELVGGEDTVVRIECLEFDKYGRILAHFYPLVETPKPDHSNSINQIMIAEGHGKPYFGGTKDMWI